MVEGTPPLTCADGAPARTRLAEGHPGRRHGPGRELSQRACPRTSTTPSGSRIPFHVVRVANRCVDKVRRRVQNETLGHRGRKDDPLYRISKLLLAGAERLDERGHDRVLLGLRHGDPHDELLGAWLAKESVRDVYLTEDPEEAKVLLDKAIVGCKGDEVPEIRSLGDTLGAGAPRS